MWEGEENPFWDYSLAHYARPEVAQACLALQDSLGANVNLLLFCCWLGSRGESLSDARLARAVQLIAEWDLNVVQPLRQVRRFLRQCSQAAEKMAETVAELELDAERVVQNSLAGWWLGTAGGEKIATEAESEVAALQRHNIGIYLNTLGSAVLSENSPLFWPLNSSH